MTESTVCLKMIDEKMQKLKHLDQEFNVFGADWHEYEIKEKLMEEELQAFEKEHNLTIPQEYRLFLKFIGNGGFGPFYGLLPLLDNDDQTANLKKEFPFSRSNPLCLSELSKEFNEKFDNCETEEEENRIEEEKDAIINPLYEKSTCGIKFLCHEGCAMFSVIVMKGKAAGDVWYFNFADDIGVFPLISPKTNKPMHFFEWFTTWLDRSIKDVMTKNHEPWGYIDFIEKTEKIK